VAPTPDAPTSPASGAVDRRLLATLRPGSEALWRDVARELGNLHRVELAASWFMASLGEQCLVLEAPPGKSPAEVAERIAHHPRLSGASAVGRFRVLAAPSGDPYSHLQRFAARIQLAAAHRLATGRGVTVAVVDTGLELEHPELAGRVVRASDFVGHGGGFTSDVHGTAVAGVLAARADNGVGIVGVAPEAELWALKACWQEPPTARSAVCDGYTLAQALDAAIVAGAQVVNLSLAGERDALVERLVRQALARGIVVVAAAEGDPPEFPAAIDGVLAVHAWSEAGPIRADAPALPGAALVAPGTDILTTVPRGGFDFLSGSSFAAAQASGVAALVLEARPEMRPAEVGALLRETAAAAAGGARLLDACAAVARARGAGSCDENP
jgi:subtilisin family serine protease